MMEVIKGKTRIESIDALRGLVVVLMVLDHTRDYFLNFPFYPTNLEHTTPGLFFNRWITNLCAPVFVMLVGTGMFIAMSRGKTKNDTAWFLFTRGIWMIIAEFTLIHFAWTFDFNLSVQDCQVIWAIGWSMIVLAGLIYLPFWCIFIFGITVVTGHNLLDGNESLIQSSWGWLHNVKTVTLDWGVPVTLHLDYPLIPWIAVPALGYVLGKAFLLTPKQRAKLFYLLGFACTFLFIILRYTNIYGDPSPWTTQKDAMFTFMSFLSASKYPPSLQYLLMTLGPALILLALLERHHNSFTRVLALFGKVPFFYYFMHIVLIHALAILIAYIRFGQATVYFGNHLLSFDPAVITPYGYSIYIVYLLWLVVLALLYPMSKWFANVKRKHKNNIWLSYV